MELEDRNRIFRGSAPRDGGGRAGIQLDGRAKKETIQREGGTPARNAGRSEDRGEVLAA